MAGWHVIDAPALCSGICHCAIKRIARVAGRPDVCLISDPLARSCEGQFLQKAFKRMWRALRIYPCAVLFVDVEHSRWAWRNSQSAIALSSQKAVPSRGGRRK